MQVETKAERKEGHVSAYRVDRGFGFLTLGTCKEDFQTYFFHINDWRGAELPARGQKVTFEPQTWMDGPTPKALNVEAVL